MVRTYKTFITVNTVGSIDSISAIDTCLPLFSLKSPIAQYLVFPVNPCEK
jgi:hypothetical protein